MNARLLVSFLLSEKIGFSGASDFPHADHPPKYIPNLLELVNLLPVSARPKILGQNVLKCYGLS